MKLGIWRILAILYFLSFISKAFAVSFVGLIGADYQPNHYDPGTTFNGHDVFYVGMNGNTPITNVYAELSQLSAAGITVVRSYASTEYTWAEIINDANALGLSVIYEAAIPFNGNSQSINAAIDVLTNVLGATTPSLFNQTVILAFAGHENYDNSNVAYIVSAIHSLQKTTRVPVGNAFVSGDLIAPPSGDISTILNASSPTAPASFDPYPFQWGVPAATAVTDGTAGQGVDNSIQWDYFQVNQNGVAGSRPIFMAESGWATAGTTNPGYACGTSGYPACAPSIANAATYLSALYTFVRNSSNNAGVLAFEAYDEPAKATPSTNMENFYGVFDSDCNLKGPNNTTLLPNTAYDPANNHGCQGFNQGALLVVQGGFGHDPLNVSITTNVNPETGLSSPITLNNISANTSPFNDGGAWPYFLVFTNATINISGNGPAPCTETITSIDSSQNITFSGNCNCSNNVCFF